MKSLYSDCRLKTNCLHLPSKYVYSIFVLFLDRAVSVLLGRLIKHSPRTRRRRRQQPAAAASSSICTISTNKHWSLSFTWTVNTLTPSLPLFLSFSTFLTLSLSFWTLSSQHSVICHTTIFGAPIHTRITITYIGSFKILSQFDFALGAFMCTHFKRWFYRRRCVNWLHLCSEYSE